VLERMNRGYTRERYLDLVAELRDAVPDVALSTDLIVGFPGETHADFEATLETVERVGYDNVFVFRYSPRPGTLAASMPDQVALTIKAERNSRLLATAGQAAALRSARLAGQTVDVLVDGRAKKNANELCGRTRCNRVVNFEADADVAIGDVAAIRITDVLPHSLRGTLAARVEEAVCLSR
jgi:tRNA-2-methylthio-N6-dimethylallyladenosine synthase